jgi:hypothetical protein
MKSLWYLLGILLISSGAHAQANSCPVAITDVRNVANTLYVLFQNNGSATLTSYEFGFIFIDLEGQAHPFPQHAHGSRAMKAGQSGKLALPTKQASEFFYPKANAYLMKATFADGSRWKDDGTHACGFTAWQE